MESNGVSPYSRSPPLSRLKKSEIGGLRERLVELRSALTSKVQECKIFERIFDPEKQSSELASIQKRRDALVGASSPLLSRRVTYQQDVSKRREKHDHYMGVRRSAEIGISKFPSGISEEDKQAMIAAANIGAQKVEKEMLRLEKEIGKIENRLQREEHPLQVMKNRIQELRKLEESITKLTGDQAAKEREKLKIEYKKTMAQKEQLIKEMAQLYIKLNELPPKEEREASNDSRRVFEKIAELKAKEHIENKTLPPERSQSGSEREIDQAVLEQVILISVENGQKDFLADLFLNEARIPPRRRGEQTLTQKLLVEAMAQKIARGEQGKVKLLDAGSGSTYALGVVKSDQFIPLFAVKSFDEEPGMPNNRKDVLYSDEDKEEFGVGEGPIREYIAHDSNLSNLNCLILNLKKINVADEGDLGPKDVVLMDFIRSEGSLEQLTQGELMKEEIKLNQQADKEGLQGNTRSKFISTGKTKYLEQFEKNARAKGYLPSAGAVVSKAPFWETLDTEEVQRHVARDIKLCNCDPNLGNYLKDGNRLIAIDFGRILPKTWHQDYPKSAWARTTHVTNPISEDLKKEIVDALQQKSVEEDIKMMRNQFDRFAKKFEEIQTLTDLQADIYRASCILLRVGLEGDLTLQQIRDLQFNPNGGASILESIYTQSKSEIKYTKHKVKKRDSRSEEQQIADHRRNEFLKYFEKQLTDFIINLKKSTS